MSTAFAETYRSLHILGEHLLAPARYAETGRIGLSVVPGGIATPPFGSDERSIAIIGGELVVRGADGDRRSPLTTLRAASEFTGTPLGAPAEVYRPATPCEPGALLPIDQAEFSRICGWYELVGAALTRFRDEIGAEAPSEITLWPEHFDVALRAGDVNYGGLAGDEIVDLPYVYVGPPTDVLPAAPSEFWNQPFGASRTWETVQSPDQAVDFFRRGRAAAAAPSYGSR